MGPCLLLPGTGDIPAYRAWHGGDLLLTPASHLLWPRRTHTVLLEMTLPSQGCNLLCKGRRQHFEGCSSVMWITRGVSQGRPGTAAWLRCGSCPPGAGGTKANAPQQHPFPCCPHAGDAHHSSVGQSPGACTTCGVFEGSSAWPEHGVPNRHSLWPVPIPKAPQVSLLGVSSLGSKPKQYIFSILSPRNARLV